MGRFNFKKFSLNHVKLRDKLLLMYMLSVFIPIVLTNVIFYQVTTSNIKNQKTRDADIAIEQLQRELRAVIDEAAGISYLYYIDPILNDNLDRTFTSEFEYVEAYNTQLRAVFNKSENAYKTIRGTMIYTDNPTIMASGPFQPLTPLVKDTEWYKMFSRKTASHPVLIQSGGLFSMMQRLEFKKAGVYTSFIRIELNMDTIRQLFENTSFQGKLYFTGQDGTVYYTNDKDVDWHSGSTELREVKVPDKSIEFTKVYVNNNYLNGWSLHGLMDERVMLEDVYKSGTFVIYLACINFLLPSLIIAGISRSIHVRLVRILRYMKRVKHQHFETIPEEDSKDEIGQLTFAFNRMTETINSLINDVYVADIQKKDLEIKQRQAQLHALHSQINPHFLFNALETIRMRSLIKGESETAKIVHHMAKIFRKSISWSRDWVTVQEELELIECFLEIQKYRFGDKLEYQLTVEDAVREQHIPKMVFLSFVENASIHGIEGSPGIGLITLQIGIAEGMLVFRLRDNGLGMTEKKLAEVLEYLQRDDQMGDHVGMKNAYYRLKLCFKESFDFRIESELGSGTTVEIRLPLREPT
ncbi:sensor histidine kinase [Paenibacillus sambharensis]|uniref:Sensor histidine kinase n=1 Tax=Paenibacillus sambharensis TaxID=1803190 RepID=A0A2W1LHP7_9BACL|nr:sensor histidine kinase [Paenibacillus sambharensis]PZD94485.1 sensor histidine kinase [Paenibacillus sambharensis]